MPKPLKILFSSSEVVPFSKTGGLADVSGSLPRALLRLGCDVRVITPYYKCVSDNNVPVKTIAGIGNHDLADNFDILENNSDFTTYFIRKDPFFLRDGLYGTPKGDHPDNALRFSFFSRAVISALGHVDFYPDIIHCNDWHTALIPFLLKKKDISPKIKTLITIHNIAYQGVFDSFFPRWKTGLPKGFYSKKDFELYGKINYLKAGLKYADHISTVSRKYAKEITTPEFGCGLEKQLIKRSKDLCGIPNGVNYDEWGPEKDRYIITNYSKDSIEKKVECKKDLLQETGLPVSLETPVIGYVGRLAYQKGVDLLAGIIDRLLKEDIYLVMLGAGDEVYQRLLTGLAGKNPGKMRFCNEFNDRLAHKIEAGSDIFMMPSRYEPCGLNQMYSIRYGTIPVVRATGGLDDVIIDYDKDNEAGNGFKFESIQPEDFLDNIKRAIKIFNDKKVWKGLMLQAMEYDFSWDKSAEEYVKLYEKILGA